MSAQLDILKETRAENTNPTEPDYYPEPSSIISLAERGLLPDATLQKLLEESPHYEFSPLNEW